MGDDSRECFVQWDGEVPRINTAALKSRLQMKLSTRSGRRSRRLANAVQSGDEDNDDGLSITSTPPFLRKYKGCTELISKPSPVVETTVKRLDTKSPRSSSLMARLYDVIASHQTPRRDDIYADVNNTSPTCCEDQDCTITPTSTRRAAQVSSIDEPITSTPSSAYAGKRRWSRLSVSGDQRDSTMVPKVRKRLIHKDNSDEGDSLIAGLDLDALICQSRSTTNNASWKRHKTDGDLNRAKPLVESQKVGFADSKVPTKKNDPSSHAKANYGGWVCAVPAIQENGDDNSLDQVFDDQRFWEEVDLLERQSQVPR